MSNRTDQAKKLANRLNSEIAKKRTWRDVAHDFPPIVKAGTLNRIAKTNGTWLPKKKKILDALFPHPDKPAAPSPEWWERVEKQGIRVMVRKMKEAVLQKGR